MNLAEKKRVQWEWGILVKAISDGVTRRGSEHALMELESTCGILEGVVKWALWSLTNERA
jgi:hypothetical protein